MHRNARNDDPNVRNWPNACVCLWAAAHSVELFLKGAILHAGAGIKKVHDLTELTKQYNAIYAGKGLEFDCPFKTVYMGFDSEEEVLKQEPVLPSITFRYPENPQEWLGPHSFDAHEFMRTLDDLSEFYEKADETFSTTKTSGSLSKA